MADREFTTEQLLAINTRNRSLLISAAAGSGKTAVLVERIIRMALDKDNPVDLDKLLVVTFTEAAAKEMKKRLHSALRAAALKDPDDTHIENQTLLLSRANISTIHSFCLKTLRMYFSEAGIDPLFRVADKNEIELLKADVLRELFEELYARENKEVFLELVEAFGDKVFDDSLQALVLKLYGFSQSHPSPENWLTEVGSSAFGDSGFEQTIWYEEFKQDCRRIIIAARENAENALEMTEACPFLPSKNADVLRSDILNFKDAFSALDNCFEAFHGAMTFKFESFAGGKAKKSTDIAFSDEDVKELRAAISEIRNRFIKKPIDNLRKKALSRPLDSYAEDCRNQARLVSELCNITKELTERFSEEKRSRNIVDFNDLEHLCLKVLQTDAAEKLKEKFSEVMVDEYQDINMTQETILSSVSKTGMFMVGDVKQSIYKFRHADPSIFMGKYDAFSNERQSKENGELITLSKNFRSRSEVIDSINFLFERLMTRKLGEIEYDDRARLYPGTDQQTKDDGRSQERKTEIFIIDTSNDNEEEIISESDEENETDELLKELSGAPLEAELAAKNILQLMESAHYKYSDFAILLRSHKLVSDSYAHVLKNHGIPAFSDASGGYFEASEVMTALSFLKIIDNPLQDIPLLSVLFSPIYSFTPDELCRIRHQNKGGCFYNALVSSAESSEKIENFLKELSHFREIAAYTPVSELIWTIFDETGLFNYAGAEENGKMRQANLSALFQRAVKFSGDAGAASAGGLFDFTTYIEKIQKEGNIDENTAKTENEDTNAVKIMSIHKSKGLEFPVVIICAMNKKFNTTDLKERVVMHQKLGVASYAVDLKRRTQNDTLPRYAITRKMLKEALSEEMRTLYVALTRAKDKLILIGSSSNPSKLSPIKTSVGEIQVTSSYLLLCESYLQWVMSVVEQGEKFFNVEIISKRQLLSPETEQENAKQKNDFINELIEIDLEADYSGQKAEIIRRLNYIYPDELSEISSKLSVSEIKRRHDERWLEDSEMLDSIRPSKSRFKIAPKVMFGEKKTDPLRYGTIMHAVMEHLPLNLAPEADVVDTLLQNLSASGIFSDEERKTIRTNDILNFLKSEIYERMSRAEFLKREARFVIGIKPSEINPNWSDGKDKDEQILVHGIIDCLFVENGEIVIVDYKTDKIKGTNYNAHSEKHIIQMKFYKIAAERILNRSVGNTLLYFFDGGIVVSV